EAGLRRHGVFRRDQDRGVKESKGAVRRDLDPVHFAIGRDQAEPLAGWISESLVPGQEALLMSGVTIVIPVWNGRDLLLRLLEKLKQQTFPIAEVLAVDNGSQDGAAEAAEQRGARVLRMGRNLGFSHAVNQGIEACRTELVALVN